MAKLSLARANKMIREAFAKAKELEIQPIGVCVYDAGGTLKAYQAQDGTSSGRFDMASGKVRAALAVGAGSRWMQNQAGDRPHFLAGMGATIPGGILPVPGAVVAKDLRGEIVAVVGISGDTSDNDEACAIAAIEACNLTAVAGG
jgi:uncharacterized protein GlcG (DUF336 family)